MKLIANNDHSTMDNDLKSLEIDNTDDPRGLDLAGIDRVVLKFPKFTDGRAYSQAFLLRRRLGFAGDIRATPTFKDRDFKLGDHGDGGIDIVAWHPMGDSRDAIPSAFAQCGCSREDWRRKHLEASPSKLRAKLNPHHPWTTYYFMPIDLRWSDGDWANKSDFGDAIMVDRLRLVRLASQFDVIRTMPLGDHVDQAYALAVM